MHTHTVFAGIDPLRLTMPDILRWRALHEPFREAYTFLLDGETKQVQMTYADLDHQAGRIAALLHDRVAPGERVLLLYQPGLEYVAAVFGCFYAGVVAVPAYPPRLDRNLLRIQSIFQDARASAALTTSTILSSLRREFSSETLMQDLQWITTDTMDSQAVASYQELYANPEALALLQYTSGSTGSPKGVMLTHTNLMQNAALLQEGFSLTSQDRSVSWLPPYHDMGLMLGILQAVYTGYPTVLITPTAFVQQPLRWLRAISSFRATFSGGPNFAFDLCVKKATPEAIAALDLSSWTLAFNGAEPVRAETLQRFAETFAPYGFRPEAFYPCYGMAETTLFVSGGSRDEKHSIRAFDGEALENGYAVEAEGGRESSRLLVGCGHVRQGQEVAIVDPQTHTRCAYGPTEATVVATSGLVPPRERETMPPSIGGPVANTQIYILDEHLQPTPIGTPGELYIGGTGLARGYFADAELTAEKFLPHPFVGIVPCADPGARLYRTGDLARYRPDGTIEYLGRSDNQIKLRGFRIELGEIEAVLRACPAVQEAVVVLQEEDSALCLSGDKPSPLRVHTAPARQKISCGLYRSTNWGRVTGGYSARAPAQAFARLYGAYERGFPGNTASEPQWQS